MTVHLDADDIARALPMAAAVDALEEAFARAPFAPTPQRVHLEDASGSSLLVMPVMTDGWAGTKLVTVVPTNPAQGLPLVAATYTLFGPPGLGPVATLDGRALTDLRTGAVSGLATRRLARPDARRLVIFGAGAQARAHLRAMAAVRPIERATVVGRRPGTADALVVEARSWGLGFEIEVGAPSAVREADIVCCCTSSTGPVVRGRDLAAGVHVNAIGAFRPDMRELDADAVAACRVVVETRAVALAEKGDLLIAEAEGRWDRAAIVADLHELASGIETGRTSAGDRTLFASVGHAYEDLVVARAVVAAV